MVDFPSSKGAAAVLVVLLAVAAGRLGGTYRELNATIDEGRHVAAAVEVYQTGAFSLYVHATPLPRYVNGLLPFLFGARLPEPDREESALLPYGGVRDGWREHAMGKYVLEAGGDYWGVLTRARLGTLAFLALLAGYVYRWSSVLYGRVAGLVAAALVTCSPTVLGHAGLATVDVAFAATYTAAAYHLWRWAEAPSRRACAVAAVACAAALLCKLPAPLFLALLFAAYFGMARGWAPWRAADRGPRPAATALRRGALFAGIVLGLTWAAYRLSLRTLGARVPWLPDWIDRRLGADSLLGGALGWVVEHVPLPLTEVFDGLAQLRTEASLSWYTFLLGETSSTGFWTYFPVALAVKSTPGLLLMALLGGAVLLRHRRAGWTAGTSYVVAGGAIYLAVVMVQRMNIGVRHALCVYPFAAVLASAVFARGLEGRARRWLPALGALLLLWHVGESVRAHPDYLAYFNGLARGREEEVLLDSNLDWGQDLARLARHAEEHGIEQITLSVFGARFGTSPAALGLRGARLLEPGERPHGWFAVSQNHLRGIGLSALEHEALEGFAWLEAHRPVARIGKSILLYRLP